jgi:1-aminocyclopropane-1-carboxylate deaminase
MLEKFARYPLTFGPSYIQPLERLSAYLGNAVRLYAKREDCNSGLAFGGNKLRKLEFIVPDAIASGADTLVSAREPPWISPSSSAPRTTPPNRAGLGCVG